MRDDVPYASSFLLWLTLIVTSPPSPTDSSCFWPWHWSTPHQYPDYKQNYSDPQVAHVTSSSKLDKLTGLLAEAFADDSGNGIEVGLPSDCRCYCVRIVSRHSSSNGTDRSPSITGWSSPAPSWWSTCSLSGSIRSDEVSISATCTYCCRFWRRIGRATRRE